MRDKRPRDYAMDICAMRSREDRRAALQAVPEHLRAITQHHVQAHFDKKRLARGRGRG